MTSSTPETNPAPAAAGAKPGFLNREKDVLYWIVAHTTGIMYLLLSLVMFWVYFEHIAGKTF